MNRFYQFILIVFGFSLTASRCCKKDNTCDEPTLSEISLTATDKIYTEGDADVTKVTLTVTLNTESPEYPVEIDYYIKHVSTDDEDVTMILSTAPKTVVLEEGETTKTFDIEITGDTDYETDEEFTVSLTNPINTILRASAKSVDIKILNDDECIVDCGYITPEIYAGYDLVWSDEFNGESIDATQWNWEVNGDGGGNNEEQYYIDSEENSYIENGNLVLVAKREDYQGKKYTSARLTTQGKYSVQYGRIDIRAIVPDGRGIWPALWMLGDNIGTDGWPNCGEIDIMELVGYEPNKVHATAHWGNSTVDKGISGAAKDDENGFSSKYHVYSLEWDGNGLKFMVDDEEIHYVPQSATSGYVNPFNQKFFFIFNIAVGGDWGGSQGIDDAAFPQKMTVDYIRVFQ